MKIYLPPYRKKLLCFLLLLLAGIAARICFIGFYMVASGSMEMATDKGDVVLVNKAAFGARLSERRGDLPLLIWLRDRLGICNALIDIRLPKLGKIERDDIVVFNHPYKKDKLVKRCVGLPGDTFEISHNRRLINGEEWREPQTVRYSYKLRVEKGVLPVDTLRTYGVNTHGFLWQENQEVLHYTLSAVEAAALQECTIVKSIQIDDFPKGAAGPALFPSAKFKFTRENFGPFVIPSAGQTVPLDTANLDFYRDVIVNHEQNALKISEGVIYINNEVKTSYTFKMSYFFMMGDNRYQSVDSRYWGFVPETAIIGKVSCILF